MSVVAAGTAHFGAILAILFVMVIVNILASSSCKQLMKAIGEDERALARLEDACMREATRWEEMKTPENIEAALMRHGLSMKPPRPDQIVHMTSAGNPYPGQLSVARARKANMRMVKYGSSSDGRLGRSARR